jgi:hypothetical protein
MFPSSYFFKKNSPPQSSPTKDEEELTSSILASIVTPTPKPKPKKVHKKTIAVKAHLRNAKDKKKIHCPDDKSKAIKVGTIIARTFKTWPCSRKPGDQPVPKIFRGMVTEINPRSKKIHVLFENSQNMRLDVSEVLPLIVKEKEMEEEKKIPAYLKHIQGVHRENEVSDLDSFAGGPYNMDTSTVGCSEDEENEVEYIGTKEVPDIMVVKVVPGNKPYVDEEQKDKNGKNNTTTTLM